MVCSPRPIQPANTPTSGQVKRTTEIFAGYKGSHVYRVVNMHPWWSGYSASWGQYRTSDCHPSSRPRHCTSPWAVWLLDGTNVRHLLEMVLHIIHTLKGIWSVTSILCLIKAVLPRSRSPWANQCSYLSSSSWACSCSGSSHFPRLWRSRASKTLPFWGLLLDYFEVPVGRTTGGTWLAGMTWPTTVCRDFNGMSA